MRPVKTYPKEKQIEYHQLPFTGQTGSQSETDSEVLNE